MSEGIDLKRDYYLDLGIQSSASKEAIKLQYKKLGKILKEMNDRDE